MTKQPNFEDPTGWKKFHEVIQILGITENGIIHYIPEGLQPYSKDVPTLPMPCPKEFHEYDKYQGDYYWDILRLEYYRKFLNILRKLKHENTVVCDDFALLPGIWYKLNSDFPEEEQKPFPFDQNDTLTFNSQNTEWITSKMHIKCREELISTGKANLKRMCSIKKEDPDCTDWKFFTLPDYEEEFQCEGANPVDMLMSELRECYYRIEDIENIASSVLLKGPVYAVDGRSLLYNGKYYTFGTSAANVIKLLYDAYLAGTPEISLNYIVEQLNPYGRSVRMRDFFQGFENWNEIVIPGKRKDAYKLVFA